MKESSESKPAAFLRHLQPLTLKVEGEDNLPYASLVLDYTVGEELVVGVPMVHGREVRIAPGTRVTVVSTHADGLRVFAVTVLRRREVPTPCLYLEWPTQVERIQRRDFVRVDVTLTARLDAAVAPPQQVTGSTRDLSAGGVQLAVDTPIPVGTDVQVSVELPDGEALQCRGRVVRSGEHPNRQSPRPYVLGIEFRDVPPAVRRSLNQFVFEVQRSQFRRDSS